MNAAASPAAHAGTRSPGPALLAACAVLYVLASAAVQAATLMAPLLTMHVMDGALEARNLDTLWVLAAGYVLALALAGILRLLRASLLAAMVDRLGRRLQVRALAASVRAALLGDRVRAGAALQDVAEARRLLSGSIVADLLDLLFIPASLAFLYAVHPLIFAVGLAACALKTLLAMLTDRATRGLVAAASATSARTTADLTGRLRQQDLLAGLGMLPSVLRRWAPEHLASVERQEAAQRRATALQALAQVLDFAERIGVLAVGAWLMTENAISPGGLFATLMVTRLASEPLAQFVERWRDWAFGTVAWRRLSALIRDAAPPSPSPVDPLAQAGLAIEALTLRLPGTTKPLVRDATLRIAPGEAWAVLGPNGAGKTTLLRTLLGVVAPTSGRVLLDGQDTCRADRADLGRRVGYLPQEPQLLEGTVLENIGRFEGGTAAEAVAAARRAGVHEVIGRLPQGYDSQAGAAAGLSGGQRRLVALARALHGRPRLLVLDEPEAGLDEPGREGLRAAVVAAKHEGSVVVLVTHEPTAWDGLLDGTLRLGGDGAWRAEAAPHVPGRASA